MLPEFAASLPALAGLCQPVDGGAASLPPPLASGDGLCPSDGLPEVSGANVALSSKAARGDIGGTVSVRLGPDHERCNQRPPAPPWKAELQERTQPAPPWKDRATVTHTTSSALEGQSYSNAHNQLRLGRTELQEHTPETTLVWDSDVY